MEQYFFPDTTIPVNFAVIDRLDLLLVYLRGRGRMTQAVRAEVRKSAGHVPNLSRLDVESTFGAVIELDRESDGSAVNNLRKRFAVRGDPATKHLGESETLHVLTTRPEFRMSRFVTEDRAAYEMAGKMGVLRHHTMDVFHELVINGELEASEAFDLLLAIEDGGHDRTLIARPSHPNQLRV